MGFSPEIENLLKIGSGIFWSLTYLLVIRRGFKDRNFGMPMAALCANIAWEFIFAFVYPHPAPQLYVDIAWFALDVVIVFQFLYFGPRVFDTILPKSVFYISFAFALLLAYLLVLGVMLEFKNWDGEYAAFGQNLMMSILFVVMLRRRDDLSGQSLYIAVFKMIGTIFPSILLYARDPSSLLMNTLYLSIFVFDALYIALVYVQCKELGIRPWRRV